MYLRIIWKLSFFILSLLGYFLITFVLTPYYLKNPNKARNTLNYVVHIFSKMFLFVFNVNVSWNIPGHWDNKGHLLISNHLGYLDILVLASRIQCSFVTSTEMRDTFLLGHICKLAGCVFVNRKNKKNISLEIKEITDALKDGVNVLVFPEATSTNGEEVIRFRKPLFQSSFDAQNVIAPITINYTQINNQKLSIKNRDEIFWYGDMSFFGHFLTVLGHERIDVSVEIHPFVEPKHFEGTLDLSLACHKIIRENYNPVR